MSVRSAQAITVEFVTSSPTTQAAVNADSLPTATLVVNGVDNAASVTVTNVDTGRYKAAVTLPTLSVGDVVEVVVSATVGAVAGKAVVWRDTKDVLLDTAGRVELDAAGLDQIPVTDPGAPASMTTLPKILVGLFRWFYGKTTLTSSQLKTYAADGVTVNATATVSDDGTTQTKGALS